MQIICISRGSYGFSSELAEQLANKMGFACISREMLTEKATDYGIPVGKLEMEVLKNRPISEQMSIDIENFKAFTTLELCKAAQKEGIVYHGRTGHLVLSGLSHILRVRAIAEPETNVKQAMARMSLGRNLAKQYVEQTNDDIRRWIRTLYHEDWEDTSLYDVTINAAHMSAESASHVLMQMAQLPEFQPTLSTKKRVLDLLLSSSCRLAIGRNEKTKHLNVTVKAKDGHVTVTYLPRQALFATEITRVLESMKEVKSFVCTIASTNILCIGEQFNPEDEYVNHMIDIAEKWNAAVEIVRMASDEDELMATRFMNASVEATNNEYNGGILDETDDADTGSGSDEGVKETMNRLIQVGRAGCSHTSHGGISGLISDISKNKDYSLIVVGNIFASKGAAQQRLKRDAVSLLIDKFQVPVLSAEDLKSEYLFGKKQFISLMGFAILSILLYLIVFTFQEPILTFVSAGQFSGSLYKKVGSAVVIFITIPIVALIIGEFYHNLLKMIKLE